MKHLPSSFLKNRHLKSGQGLLEYILMIFLVALLVYAAVNAFGSKVQSGFTDATTSLENAIKSGTGK